MSDHAAKLVSEDGVVVLHCPPELEREALVNHDRSLNWITENVSVICEEKTRRWWWIAFLIFSPIALLVPLLFGYQVSNGIGVWGENQPFGWAWDITNFVFWIGIGHAGTLISAILFLTRQKWRTSINRASEAMTLFAVMCAGLYPGFHVGRVWKAWYLFPIPNWNGLWQNYRSPLLWDVGLIPDLAMLRDRAKSKIKQWAYGIAAIGWRGGNRHWQHYEMAYLILAGLSTPLVLSVHSIVSFDFATSIVPGWHTTIFPPYFVAGAVFGGFAMVLTLMLPARLLYPQLDDMMTRNHVDKMAKIILLTGSIVGYAYLMELFIAMIYSGHFYEYNAFYNRATGWYAWHYFAMMFCNVVTPQIFWFKAMRRNYIVVFIACQFVNAGMWYERFVIIGTTLAQDFLPSSWGHYTPSWVEVLTFVGTFGFFITAFLLFMRFLPMVCAFEVKAVTPQADPHHVPKGHDHEQPKGAALNAH
jgi:molybdopterin-containing oxidoreductase family membrane subunit